MRSDESKIQFQAMALGLTALFGDPDHEEPKRLQSWIDRALPEDNPTRIRLTEQLARYWPLRHDNAARADWGRELRDLALYLGRRPIDLHRSDIHG